MTRLTLSLLVAAATGLWLPAPAHAQLARTFVSALSGNDANDCSQRTPCRTFQRAHDTTLASGEITVLEPGGYGAVTITKAISIINDGVGEAGTLVSGGLNGITVAAAAADAVSLRGLTIKGIGFGGGRGIVFNSGKSLTVENCVIRNLTGTFPAGTGIHFIPSASARLAVSSTLLADNTGGDGAIAVAPTGSGNVTVMLNRVEMYNNIIGLFATGDFSTGTVKAVVANSIAARNGGTGYFVQGTGSAAPTEMMIVRSVAANNGTGLFSTGPHATLRVGTTAVTGGLSGWATGPGGTLQSYGSNNVNGNVSEEDPMPLIPAK